MWAVVLLWQPAPCSGGVLSDAWSRFDRAASIFDPVGTYVSQPIEKTIPALTFKGFFRQWSDINLHRNQKVGFRNKDFRFLQLQNLLEIELHYQFTDNLELTNINHFLYDGVYNWQDAGGLFAPRLSECRTSFSRFITGRVIYTTYDGGGRDSTFGQYDKWDNIGWEVSYEF